MTKPWLGGAPGQRGESSRRKAGLKGMHTKPLQEMQGGAVGQGQHHQARVMHSQAFALGSTRIL